MGVFFSQLCLCQTHTLSFHLSPCVSPQKYMHTHILDRIISILGKEENVTGKFGIKNMKGIRYIATASSIAFNLCAYQIMNYLLVEVCGSDWKQKISVILIWICLIRFLLLLNYCSEKVICGHFIKKWEIVFETGKESSGNLLVLMSEELTTDCRDLVFSRKHWFAKFLHNFIHNYNSSFVFAQCITLFVLF